MSHNFPARIFFVTFNTWVRRPIFRSQPMAELMLQVLRDGQRQKKYRVHAFVIMPDHLHVLLTPDDRVSVERAVQFIKGSFSFRVKHGLGVAMEIWQRSFTNHRVRDPHDYQRHITHIVSNPRRAGLLEYNYVYPRPAAKAEPIQPPDPVG